MKLALRALLVNLMLFQPWMALAEDFHVGAGQTYPTITAAIADAPNGVNQCDNRVIVHGHQITFAEQLSINKTGLCVIPNTGDLPIIDRQGLGGNAVSISADEVGFGPFEVINWGLVNQGGSGVFMGARTGVTIFPGTIIRDGYGTGLNQQGVNTRFTASGVTVRNITQPNSRLISTILRVAGSGYTVNDILTLVHANGSAGTAATLKVTGVSGGQITATTIDSPGNYTATPSGVGSPTVAPSSVTQQGTPGSTTYYYWYTRRSSIGETLLSPSRQTTTSHAALDGTNYNVITWSASPYPSTVDYCVYRTTSASAPSGTGDFLVGCTASTTINDQSNTLQSATIPTDNTTNWLNVTGGTGSGARFSATFSTGYSGDGIRLQCDSTDNTYVNGCLLEDSLADGLGGTGTDGIKLTGKWITLDNVRSLDWIGGFHADGVQILGNVFWSHIRILGGVYRNATQNIFAECSIGGCDDLQVVGALLYNSAGEVNGIDMDEPGFGSGGVHGLVIDGSNITNAVVNQNTIGRHSGIALSFIHNTGAEFKNNVIKNEVGNGWLAGTSAACTGWSSSNSNNNQFYIGNPAQKYMFACGTTFHDTLSAFNAVTGSDTNSGEGAVSFVDEANGDHHLAADTGDGDDTVCAAASPDMDGVTRPAGCSRGAFQYATSRVFPRIFLRAGWKTSYLIEAGILPITDYLPWLTIRQEAR